MIYSQALSMAFLAQENPSLALDPLLPLFAFNIIIPRRNRSNSLGHIYSLSLQALNTIFISQLKTI